MLDVFLKRIVNVHVTIQLNKFRISQFFQFLFSWEGYACAGGGYDIDEITLNGTIGYVVLTCYNGLATDLFDWWSVFDGDWLKFGGECAYLEPWTTMEIASTTLLAAVSDQVLIGGIVKESSGCVHFGDYTPWQAYMGLITLNAILPDGILEFLQQSNEIFTFPHSNHQHI